jgi:hypothetical protein
MVSVLLGSPDPLCAYAAAALSISFGLVRLGHRILDLLRDLRAFRSGH